MPTAQENCGIAALVFTTIAFVVIIVIVAQTFQLNQSSPQQWTAIAAVGAIALGLLLTEIALVVPYSDLNKSKDDDDENSEN